MTSNTHKKHAFVQKPTGGKFHRNEVAILGAPCGIIHQLVEHVQPALAHLKLGYVDDNSADGNKISLYSIL